MFQWREWGEQGAGRLRGARGAVVTAARSYPHSVPVAWERGVSPRREPLPEGGRAVEGDGGYR